MPLNVESEDSILEQLGTKADQYLKGVFGLKKLLAFPIIGILICLVILILLFFFFPSCTFIVLLLVNGLTFIKLALILYFSLFFVYLLWNMGCFTSVLIVLVNIGLFGRYDDCCLWAQSILSFFD